MRTRQEIDQDYTNTAALYGDLQFKLTRLGETREQVSEELKRLFIKLSELIQEPAGTLAVQDSIEVPVIDAIIPEEISKPLDSIVE